MVRPERGKTHYAEVDGDGAVVRTLCGREVDDTWHITTDDGDMCRFCAVANGEKRWGGVEGQ